MGIAWFDEVSPPEEQPALRTGGLPLMPKTEPWPTCARCSLPMLFRAQLPLAITGAVGYDDDRLVLVFECHGRPEPETCDEGWVTVVRSGGLLLHRPPEPQAFHVRIRSVGNSPENVFRLIASLEEISGEGVDRRSLTAPFTLLWGAPPSIAFETVRALEDAGAKVDLLPHPPTLLATPRGGKLVPFDDDVPGTSRTTLPPLRELRRGEAADAVRGLLGGWDPGDLDAAGACSCGRPRRTAVRLFAQRERDPSGASLGPALVQICLRCDTGRLLRSRGAMSASS